MTYPSFSRIYLSKAAALLIILLLFLPGCGGGGGAVPSGNAFVLQKTTFVVPKDGSVTISAVTGATVVLTGTVPASVGVGSTLIGNLPGQTQFLRKVTGVTSSGSTHTFQTTPAMLTDIFNDAQIHNIQNVAASVLSQMKPAQPGITFSAAPATRDLAYSNEIAFNNVLVADAGGLNAVGSVNGKIDYSFGFETALNVGVHGVFDLRPKINKFRVAPFVKLNGSLTVTGKVQGSFSKQIPIGLPISFPIASLGPVPININLQLMLELDGRLDINGQLQVSGGIDMSAGIDCTDDNWSVVQTFDHTFSVTPPHLAATASLTLSALQPQVGIGIPDIGNMYVNADVLRASVNFAFQSQPAGFSITSSGDFKFTAGGKIQLGPFTLYNGTVGSFDLGSFNLGSPIFLPEGASTIVYSKLSSGSVSFYAMDSSGSNLRPVFNDSTNRGYLDLSYDSSKVVYVQPDGLYVADITGLNAHKIVDSAAVPGIEHPCWSPDGSKIAFDSGQGGAKNLYIVPSSGGTPNQVGDQTYESIMPAFSPDGTKLAFAYSDGSGNYTIRELNLASNVSKQLVGSDSHWEPSYSPDGSSIVCDEVETGEIDVVDNQGIGITKVTSGTDATHPRFSPDGQNIIFAAGFFPRQLISCTVSGKNQHVFSNDLGDFGGDPCWRQTGAGSSLRPLIRR